MNIDQMNIRSKEERQNEIKPILLKLKELRLTVHEHPEIKELFTQIQLYIQKGINITLNIPFPTYNCWIKGILNINRREKSWVKLESNK